MGGTSSPIPDENKLKEIIQSVNEFNKSSQNKNKIIINSANTQSPIPNPHIKRILLQ